MSNANAAKGLRDRLTTGTEDRLGRALSDLLENPILTSAIGHAFDARERAAQAQELAMGALNLPSASDIERLTRRLRSLSQRLEGIEDGVDRLDRTLATKMGVGTPSTATTPTSRTAEKSVDARLGAIEQQLQTLTKAVGDIRPPRAAPRGRAAATPSAATTPSKSSPKRRTTSKSPATKRKG
jgi:hypothetical protein